VSGNDTNEPNGWWTNPPGTPKREQPVNCCLCCGWFGSILILGIIAQGAYFSGTPLQAAGLAGFVIFTGVLTIYWVIIKGKGPFR